jgi:hypothetical protein
MNNRIKLFYIALIILLVNLLPSISGEETVYIRNPTSVSSIITVNKDFSINFQLTYLFINSLNQPVRVEYYFPVINYPGEGFDIYATNSSALASTVNGTVYEYNTTLQPYSDGGVVFEWFTPESDNNPSDDIYKLDWGTFAEQEKLLESSIEIRLPLQKGGFEYLVEPVNYSTPPKNQDRIGEHLILYWGEELQQAIHLEYTYGFNLNEFIYRHPLEMMFVAGFIGVFLTIMVEKLIVKYRKTNKK